MDVDGLVEAVSAAAGAAVAVGGVSRRYWTRREARQQAAFRVAVRQIVDEALAPVIRRQDRQDRTIGELTRAVNLRNRK